jgi:hypothetical protein
MDYNERFGQIESLLADLLRRMDRQSEQIDSIISILKISDERQTRAEERQTRAEERQDAMLAEIKAQGKRLDEQGQRQDIMLKTQMQMLELMSRNSTKTDELTQRIPSILEYETRVRRLEEAVFNKAG